MNAAEESSDEAATEQLVEMPEPLEFMLRTPLYDEFTIPSRHHLHRLLYFNGRFDAYCAACGAPSIFERSSPDTDSVRSWEDSMSRIHLGYRELSVRCVRDSGHVYTFWFLVRPPTILKAGQFPSVADMHVADIRKYRKVLGDDRIRELSRADGLASHGIGIGSFVYLRRIFESLIEEAHQHAVATGGFDEGTYQSARMDDRIRMLSVQLPQFLVENRSLYAILSKGVHELTENECRNYFDAVRTGIEIILDEHLETAKRAERLRRASGAIAEAKAKLGKGGAGRSETTRG